MGGAVCKVGFSRKYYRWSNSLMSYRMYIFVCIVIKDVLMAIRNVLMLILVLKKLPDVKDNMFRRISNIYENCHKTTNQT